MGRVIIGVDLGQRIDPTALAVVEEVRPPATGGRWLLPAGMTEADARSIGYRADQGEMVYHVRHLERLLGKPYVETAGRVASVVRNVRAIRRGGDPPFVIVDATGVGRPVVELIGEAMRGTGGRLSAATFTYGDQLTGRLGDPELRVGKAFLVSRLQALFAAGRIKLPAGHPEAAAMLDELVNYQIRIDPDGADKYGAFSTGKHDDLVTAVGLACLGVYKPMGVAGIP